MKNLLSRREALKSLGLGAGALFAVGAVTRAAPGAGALPHVGAGDPTAAALAYVENAQGLDAKKTPNYKAGEKCGNCLQSKGKGNDGDAWIGCTLFPGKVVSAQGWCRAYVARS
ncbi:MAG: high-potential iron-sulfur protein [Steroidobacteraceae bacterium]